MACSVACLSGCWRNSWRMLSKRFESCKSCPENVVPVLGSYRTTEYRVSNLSLVRKSTTFCACAFWLFFAMLSAIVFVSGRRWNWLLRQRVANSSCWNSLGYSCQASFVVEFFHERFDELSYATRKWRRRQWVPGKCVHEWCLCSAPIYASIKYFIQRIYCSSIGENDHEKLVEESFHLFFYFDIAGYEEAESAFLTVSCSAWYMRFSYL